MPSLDDTDVFESHLWDDKIFGQHCNSEGNEKEHSKNNEKRTGNYDDRHDMLAWVSDPTGAKGNDRRKGSEERQGTGHSAQKEKLKDKIAEGGNTPVSPK